MADKFDSAQHTSNVANDQLFGQTAIQRQIILEQMNPHKESVRWEKMSTSEVHAAIFSFAVVASLVLIGLRQLIKWDKEVRMKKKKMTP